MDHQEKNPRPLSAYPISVFWFYLVMIFSGIMFIPWWEGKVSLLPLGSVYFNSPGFHLFLLVFLPHASISVLVAWLVTLAHKRLFR